jgi:hypothetical protein
MNHDKYLTHNGMLQFMLKTQLENGRQSHDTLCAY